jgi:hypothetical protein
MKGKFNNLTKILFCTVSIILFWFDFSFDSSPFWAIISWIALLFSIFLALYVLIRRNSTFLDRFVMGVICILIFFQLPSFSKEVKIEFESKTEFYNYVKFKRYDSLVEIWGEPDYQSDEWFDSGYASSLEDCRVTVKWNKLKVKGCRSVELIFDVLLLSPPDRPASPYKFKLYSCN